MVDEINITKDMIEGFFAGSAVGAVIAFSIFLAVLFLAALYIYFAIAWTTIARKLGHRKPWIAWIPIANFALILQLGGFHWAWIFLILIPFVGWIALFILGIIATWRVFEMRNYPGFYSLSMLLPYVGPILYFIALGFVAWKDKGIQRKMSFPSRSSRRRKRK